MRLPRPTAARRIPGISLLFLLTLTTVAAAPPGLLQKTGRIAGHVRSGSSAVANAQVFIVGTALHTLTDSAGAYVFPAVAEGKVQVRVAMIGYKA
ncbi:MAG TPA: carboxypeptidase-like regulatory domain-containing protein, partial [Gemmatimonadales bacterium]